MESVKLLGAEYNGESYFMNSVTLFSKYPYEGEDGYRGTVVVGRDGSALFYRGADEEAYAWTSEYNPMVDNWEAIPID